MEDNRNMEREEVYTKAVRAGKRTYFFDVKEMKSGEYYITITESKRRFDQESGKFFFEKHKLFLYKEDYDKFSNALSSIIHFVRTGEKDDDVMDTEVNTNDEFNTNFDSLDESTDF